MPPSEEAVATPLFLFTLPLCSQTTFIISFSYLPPDLDEDMDKQS